ncbi:hypothetical protein CRYUN_Cryun35bG0051900 [Craigia yunnanensis]
MGSQLQPNPGLAPISSSATVTTPAEFRGLRFNRLPSSVTHLHQLHLLQFDKMESVKDVLGKWGKKAAEDTKKAKEITGNMWQHLETGLNFADAAAGRIAQGTKVLQKVVMRRSFEQHFRMILRNSF